MTSTRRVRLPKIRPQSARLAGAVSLRRVCGVAARVGGMAVLVGALAGCQNITGNGSISQVRIIDASPDAPGMDIYQAGTGLAYNLGLGTITSYVFIAPGTSTITCMTAGSKQVLTTARETFAPSAQYTVLIGNVSAGLSETVLVDQSTPAPTGQVAIRILNQAVRANSGVDVYLVPSTGTLATVSPVLTDVAFGTNGGYVNVPAGTYTLILLPTGTVPVAGTVPAYTGAKVTYSSGAARTLILLDQKGSTEAGFQVITADDFDPSTLGS